MTLEEAKALRLSLLAADYLILHAPDTWYEVFMAHDYTTRPQAMIDAARRKRAEVVSISQPERGIA